MSKQFVVTHRARYWGVAPVLLLCIFKFLDVSAGTRREMDESNGIWSRDNLIAWEIASADTKKRGSEERARLLNAYGIKRYAYLATRDPFGDDRANVSQLDINNEIEAMQRHGIEISAWYFWVNMEDPAKDPNVRAALEAFKRYRIQPQIWVSESFAGTPRSPEDWHSVLPSLPVGNKSIDEYPARKRADLIKGYIAADAVVQLSSYPKTLEEYEARVQREADRIHAFVKIASECGCKVNLYNHRGWFGMIENQLAIIKRLEEMGVTTVGLVYNFSHSRDFFHDDSKVFAKLWKKMQPYVVAVNVTAVSLDGLQPLYLSHGVGEIEMMRTIAESGWKGPVGLLLGDKGGDVESNIRKTLLGLDWIVGELRKPGSAGPRPVLTVP